MKKILLMLFISLLLVGCTGPEVDIVEDDPIVDDDPIVNDDPITYTEIAITVSYNQLPNINLEVMLDDSAELDYITTDALLFDEFSYTYVDGIIIFQSEYLETLSDGSIVVTVVTDKDDYIITIEIIDDRIAVLSSSAIVNYDEEININLLFELYGGSVVKLSGNNISEIDYEVDENSVIISSSFIQNLLINDPLMETVIVSYYLENKGFITIGYIFIEIN